MRILGIETSCDETAAAVADENGRVYGEVVHSQIELHAKTGGVVPELAARDHARNVEAVVREALTRANIEVPALDAIAVTARPGLVGALLVGVEFAKGLALGAKKPLVEVDHLIGHMLAVFLAREGELASPPAYPFVALLVSGGHTGIYRVDGPRGEEIAELGATRDDAAGEAFDKVAKALGLGYPGGPLIDALASRGDPSRFPFESPMPSPKSAEFSFSGLKTQVQRFLETHGKPTEEELPHVAASFQKAVVDVLVKKLVAAALREGVSHIAIGGGVAANRELRARLEAAAKAAGLTLYLPSLKSCTDNAAMIAFAGALAFERGAAASFSLDPSATTSIVRLTRKGRGHR